MLDSDAVTSGAPCGHFRVFSTSLALVAVTRNAPRRTAPSEGCLGGEAAGPAAERDGRRTRGASGKSSHAKAIPTVPADVLLPLELMHMGLALRDSLLGKEELESAAQ